MRKFYKTPLIAISLAVLLGCTQSWALFGGGGFKGGEVYDPVRHTETKPITAEYIKQVANTATQIANQVTDIASMSPEAMLVHTLGVESDLENLLDTVNKKQGITRDQPTPPDSSLHKNTSTEDQMNHNKKMLIALYKTYQDAFKGTKLTADIDKKIKRVNELLKENQKTVGNKDSKQVSGQLQAEKTSNDLEKEQMLGLITSVITAEAIKENQQEAQAAQNTFNTISMGAADPYNPTAQDRENFKRPEGRGFIRF